MLAQGCVWLCVELALFLLWVYQDKKRNISSLLDGNMDFKTSSKLVTSKHINT